jgi:hypothetical protein
MLKIFSKSNFFIFFFSTIVSLILLKILQDPNLWLKIFKFLNTPVGGLDVADARSIQMYSELFFKNGFVDPEAVDSWNRKFSAISFIWLKLSILFKLNNPINFYIFIFLSFNFYIFSVLKIAMINKNIIDFITIILAFLSTSSFYLIERGNFDLIIFFLITLLVFIRNTKYKIFLIIILSFLKINLIYLFIILIKNLKLFFYYFIIATIILTINYRYIFSGYNDIGTAADMIHYGLFTIVKSLVFYSNAIFKLDININYYTQIISFIFLFFIITIILFFLLKKIDYIKVKINKLCLNFSLNEELFIAGAVFYIFSFLFFSAPDYKLVFLIFTLPFFLENKSLYIGEIILTLIVLNSCLFEVFSIFNNIFNGLHVLPVDTKYNLRYFIFGVFVHFLKIFLFIRLIFITFYIYNKKIFKN